MSKNYNQSKKAKEEFKSELLDYMLEDKFKVYDKWELAAKYDVTEREIRRRLEEIANYYPVIATSDKKGYAIAVWDENMDNESLIAVHEEIMHQIAEINSRIKNLKARLKPLIANHIVLKDKFIKEE